MEQLLNSDTQGVKVRVRRCLAGVCAGALRERLPCTRPCTGSERPLTTSAPQQTFRNRFIAPLPNGNRQTNMILRKIDHWGPWSACSVTCGTGQKLRRRNNCIGQGSRDEIFYFNGNECSECAETGTCVMQACRDTAPASTWTDWSHWSECSVNCGEGLQFRKRACFAAFCRGKDSDVRNCHGQRCPQTTTTERPLINRSGLWTGWSSWSACSTKCGVGQRTRRRRCYQGSCMGDDNEKERCVGSQC
uniref:TSP1_spondin domain-containing protein n=1 Tax=Caenorhabditis tropicalis TaxID=1561998 RepID=A0A1I7UQ76_9PELO